MLFNSLEFIVIFLPTALLLYYLLSGLGKRQYAFFSLLLCSFFFYGWWNPSYLLLLCSSLLVDYVISLKMLKTTPGSKSAKLLLTLGICFNLSLIAYYKYTNFGIALANDLFNTNLSLVNLVLPLGISFYTFQKIAWLVDLYRGYRASFNLRDYCLFIVFFPQLIAGPIVHHSEIMPQLQSNKSLKFDINKISLGLFVFTIGLCKKVLLADNISQFASPVFYSVASGNPVSTFEAWGGTLAYSMQLYFDFSGYSDMAIGLGLMFGILIPLNFNSPYKALNIIEFWRRWHMTLSRFLRDYLYISLGGNKKGSVRRYVNLMITMLLGGLWHGAGWTFIVWGGLHGAYLVVNHFWQKSSRNLPILNCIFDKSIPSFMLTFLAVNVAWVFFRASDLSTAFRMLSAMFMLDGISLNQEFLRIATAMQMPQVSETMKSLGIEFLPSMIIPLSDWLPFGLLGIVALVAIAFFAPNAHELQAKLDLYDFNSKEVNPKNLNSPRGRLAGFLAGAAFFIAMLKILSSSSSEFLYFNF